MCRELFRRDFSRNLSGRIPLDVIHVDGLVHAVVKALDVQQNQRIHALDQLHGDGGVHIVRPLRLAFDGQVDALALVNDQVSAAGLTSLELGGKDLLFPLI